MKFVFVFLLVFILMSCIKQIRPLRPEQITNRGDYAYFEDEKGEIYVFMTETTVLSKAKRELCEKYYCQEDLAGYTFKITRTPKDKSQKVQDQFKGTPLPGRD